MNDGQPELRALHAEIDEAARALEELHAAALQCRRGCSACCVDDLGVFEVEAERIRRAHPDLLAHGTPHPPGACAFLDAKGACRIYEDRPYVCRTQGLPLRWEEPDGARGAKELRDVCSLNLVGTSLEELPDAACWRLGPFEGRLAAIQHATDGGEGRRTALRSLFRRR